jgi:cytochrome-b5 reductase
LSEPQPLPFDNMEQLYIAIGIGLFLLVVAVMWIASGSRTFLERDKFKGAKLIEKETITHNTKRFRFSLPGSGKLGLPVGQHISFAFTDDRGVQVMRSYTPVSGDETVGYVDFVIKVYPNGKMSQFVDKLCINDPILMRGPKGTFKYTANMKRSFGAPFQ